MKQFHIINEIQEVLTEMEESFSTEELIFKMKKLGQQMTAQLELNLSGKGMTGVQVYFMVYILRHHPKGTYLTELCRETGMSKPTLSALIKKLREKDYLYILADPDDVRKKKVLPTEKLAAEGEGFVRKAEQMETRICSVLDQQEKSRFGSLEEKLLAQFARMERNEKSRQEVYLQ